jgi:adenylate cyclase
MEIEQIGQMTGRLFELASDAARPPVRLVKMIGDAAMFASREPVPVIESVLELVEAAGTDEMPALKAGAATGPALGRGGDWYGRPVNLAARITSFARPDSVVVDEAVKELLESEDGERFSFSFAGKRRFKGISEETAVHRIRLAQDSSSR